MHENLFFELSLVLAATGVISSITRLLKQPLIIGYIVSGLLLGPYFFNLVHSEGTFSTFSRFGIALLLFIVGLGLNPKVIKEVGRASAIVGTGQVLFTSGVGFLICTLLGFDTVTSFFVGVALTFSSTTIVLKILNDKKETNQLYGKIAIGMLLVQDIVASIMLLFVARTNQTGPFLPQLSMTLGFLILIIAGLFVAQAYILPRFRNFLSASQEFLFNFSLAWGFGIASLFALAGLSIEVGAFFAGVVLATQPYAQEVSSRMRPLRDFFILIFFIILGVELKLENISSLLPQAFALSLFVLIGNPLIVMIMMGIQGYTKKTSFKLGLTVAQISEFSLIFILLANSVGSVSEQIVSLVTLVGIITIALSTYTMLFDDVLYSWFEKYLSLFERRTIREVPHSEERYDIILFGFSRGGHEFVRTFEKLDKNFIVVDYDPEAADELIDNRIPFVYGDMGDVEFLNGLNMEDAKVIISTVSDPSNNLFIVRQARQMNERAIVIAHSEKPEEAARLYEEGATYVMMPHYIGSERITHMLRKSKLKKADFTPARERHLRYVQKHL
jgi:Kef-type K+ transport system membrane component KefB